MICVLNVLYSGINILQSYECIKTTNLFSLNLSATLSSFFYLNLNSKAYFYYKICSIKTYTHTIPSEIKKLLLPF